MPELESTKLLQPVEQSPSFMSRFSPQRREKLLKLVLLVLPFIYPGIALFRMDGLLASDLEHFFRNHQSFVIDNLKRGIIPFWNPYSFAGIPEFGNPEIAPMYPPHFLGLWFFGPVMMGKIKFLMHLSMAGIGCFLFLRYLGISAGIAFFCAWTLEWSGFHITRYSLMNVGAVMAWLPLLLYLNARFLSKMKLGRAMGYSLFAGIFLMLFYPQISMTIFLVLLAWTLGSPIVFHKRETASLPSGMWPVIHRFVLPVVEAVFLLSLLRYPPEHIPFPREGWRNAFSGMGAIGLAALIAVLVLNLAFLFMRKKEMRFHWKQGLHGLAALVGVWILASSLAAPQLAVTAEYVPHTNQSVLDHSEDSDFFTGVQAYGSIREWVRHSALALHKESVNNMALGPVIFALPVLGILMGLHRRRRVFLFFLLLAFCVGAIYMAAPLAFDVFRRLPFFRNFAGISRYLGFFNFAWVVLAALSLHVIALRLPLRFRRPVSSLIILLLVVNLLFLLNHQAAFWKALDESSGEKIPRQVEVMVRSRMNVSERILMDTRSSDDYLRMLAYPFSRRLPGISGYSPIRLKGYDDFLQAHNASLGVSHEDYHRSFFEPAPTVWTRALRNCGFIYPPGNTPPINNKSDFTSEFEHVVTRSGWSLCMDFNLPPMAWPEEDPDRAKPRPASEGDWRLYDDQPNHYSGEGLHRRRYRFVNALDAPWLVMSMPWYPGWKARVSGRKVEPVAAHGFLMAVPVNSRYVTVDLEYKPLSFQLGWLIFCWGFWVWLILWRYAHTPIPAGRALHFRRLFVTLAGCGIVPVMLICGRILFIVPDSLVERLVELAILLQLAMVTGLSASAWLRRRRWKPGH
ncbi:MAG: hypothetical protein ACLFQ6_03890 [Candidatus Sumerlaeia bacterium]